MEGFSNRIVWYHGGLSQTVCCNIFYEGARFVAVVLFAFYVSAPQTLNHRCQFFYKIFHNDLTTAQQAQQQVAKLKDELSKLNAKVSKTPHICTIYILSP